MYLSDDGLWFAGLTQGENVFVTMSSLMTTFVMLFVLYNACKPFNWFRKIVFSIVMIASGCFLFVPKLTNFVALDFSNFGNSEWLLLVIMVLQQMQKLK